MSGESVHSYGDSIQMTGNKIPSEKILRRRLKYFFMNPCEKWKAKKKFPWKLVLQVIKIIIVTIQLAMFGYARAGHIDFIEKNIVAFRHLFLKGWDASYEAMPYPPATGPFAVYTVPQFYDSINYALHHYNNTEKLSLASFTYVSDNDTKPLPTICVVHYQTATIWPFNQTFIFNSNPITDCYEIDSINNTDGNFVYDTVKFLSRRSGSIHFNSMLQVTLKFSLNTIHLQGMFKGGSPDCYRFDIQIIYDNSAHNGQIQIKLQADEMSLACHGTVVNKTPDYGIRKILVTFAFDSLVIFVSVLSLFLCARSILRAQRLRREAVEVFKNKYDKVLSCSEHLEFLNMWYVLIILNDFLMILGSIFKIQIESKMSHRYEACGVLLGTANLLVWIGFLRYLNFFKKYNVLILTMKKSVPNIMRFLVCAGVFYMSFTLCGWVVLGPYHIKFRTFSAASECLFSLINGDDMFNTFEALSPPDAYIWWYSRVYLYIFISFFIYVVLSVFISIIMDTYETIKADERDLKMAEGEWQLGPIVWPQWADDMQSTESNLSNSTTNKHHQSHELSGSSVIEPTMMASDMREHTSDSQKNDLNTDENVSNTTTLMNTYCNNKDKYNEATSNDFCNTNNNALNGDEHDPEKEIIADILKDCDSSDLVQLNTENINDISINTQQIDNDDAYSEGSASVSTTSTDLDKHMLGIYDPSSDQSIETQYTRSEMMFSSGPQYATEHNSRLRDQPHQSHSITNVFNHSNMISNANNVVSGDDSVQEPEQINAEDELQEAVYSGEQESGSALQREEQGYNVELRRVHTNTSESQLTSHTSNEDLQSVIEDTFAQSISEAIIDLVENSHMTITLAPNERQDKEVGDSTDNESDLKLQSASSFIANRALRHGPQNIEDCYTGVQSSDIGSNDMITTASSRSSLSDTAEVLDKQQSTTQDESVRSGSSSQIRTIRNADVVRVMATRQKSSIETVQSFDMRERHIRRRSDASSQTQDHFFMDSYLSLSVSQRKISFTSQRRGPQAEEKIESAETVTASRKDKSNSIINSETLSGSELFRNKNEQPVMTDEIATEKQTSQKDGVDEAAKQPPPKYVESVSSESDAGCFGLCPKKRDKREKKPEVANAVSQTEASYLSDQSAKKETLLIQKEEVATPGLSCSTATTSRIATPKGSPVVSSPVRSVKTKPAPKGKGSPPRKRQPKLPAKPPAKPPAKRIRPPVSVHKDNIYWPNWYLKKIPQSRLNLFRKILTQMDNPARRADPHRLFRMVTRIDDTITYTDVKKAISAGLLDDCLVDFDKFLYHLAGGEQHVSGQKTKYTARQKLFYTVITDFSVDNTNHKVRAIEAAKRPRYRSIKKTIGVMTDKELEEKLRYILRDFKDSDSPYAKPQIFCRDRADIDRLKKAKKRTNPQADDTESRTYLKKPIGCYIGSEAKALDHSEVLTDKEERRKQRIKTKMANMEELTDDEKIAEVFKEMRKRGDVIVALRHVRHIPHVRKLLARCPIYLPVTSSARRHTTAMLKASLQAEARERPRGWSRCSVSSLGVLAEPPIVTLSKVTAIQSKQLSLNADNLDALRKQCQSSLQHYYEERKGLIARAHKKHWRELQAKEIQSKTLYDSFVDAFSAYQPIAFKDMYIRTPWSPSISSSARLAARQERPKFAVELLSKPPRMKAADHMLPCQMPSPYSALQRSYTPITDTAHCGCQVDGLTPLWYY